MIPSPTEVSVTEIATPETADVSTPHPEGIVLPVNRQVSPSDIQSYVSWFDAGFGGRGPNSCQYTASEGAPSIQVLPLDSFKQLLYEGEAVIACAMNLSSSQVIWTIETPDGDWITTTTDLDSSQQVAIAEFVPSINPLPGLYKIRAISGDIVLETQFEILPAQSPTIWTVGNIVEPGQKITVYYSGFEPAEVITTIWYDDARPIATSLISEYRTSWQTHANASGFASETISIPPEICISGASLLAAQGQRPTQKGWFLDGGFELDLLASAITWIVLETDCPVEVTEDEQIDNSSRLLRQINMGTANSGVTQFGTLNSVLEAHNWVYEATAGEEFLVRVEFLQNDFPVDRISIIDPSGSIVFECADALRGCGMGGMSEVEYQPAVSGVHLIRIDMFDEGDGAYSLLVDSQRESATIPDKVIIDDLDPALYLGGPSQGWRVAPYGYKDSTHWTYCTDEEVSNWAKWIPQLSASGHYEVFVFVPEHNAGTTQARYHVFHNDIENEVTVRQADYANEWVSIGTYQFAATGNEYVYLEDNTGESRELDVTIAFDAIKFVYVSE
jgi:hypothetical protein